MTYSYPSPLFVMSALFMDAHWFNRFGLIYRNHRQIPTYPMPLSVAQLKVPYLPWKMCLTAFVSSRIAILMILYKTQNGLNIWRNLTVTFLSNMLPIMVRHLSGHCSRKHTSIAQIYLSWVSWYRRRNLDSVLFRKYDVWYLSEMKHVKSGIFFWSKHLLLNGRLVNFIFFSRNGTLLFKCKGIFENSNQAIQEFWGL